MEITKKGSRKLNQAYVIGPRSRINFLKDALTQDQKKFKLTPYF